jgi:hypothetical protein
MAERPPPPPPPKKPAAKAPSLSAQFRSVGALERQSRRNRAVNQAALLAAERDEEDAHQPLVLVARITIYSLRNTANR